MLTNQTSVGFRQLICLASPMSWDNSMHRFPEGFMCSILFYVWCYRMTNTDRNVQFGSSPEIANLPMATLVVIVTRIGANFFVCFLSSVSTFGPLRPIMMGGSMPASPRINGIYTPNCRDRKAQPYRSTAVRRRWQGSGDLEEAVAGFRRRATDCLLRQPSKAAGALPFL
jgi:hypothetical protein